jgi:hypothetical protein
VRMMMMMDDGSQSFYKSASHIPSSSSKVRSLSTGDTHPCFLSQTML